MRIPAILTALLGLSATAVAGEEQRNVILFLGDGMSIGTVTAARIHAGQLAGGQGEEHELTFDRFPHVGLVRTFNVDRQVPDSAGTMSAIMTGQPGRYGVISVDPEVLRGDCANALARPAPTLLERAEKGGYATGVVTTTRITHATPAATYAHSPDRQWESDNWLPAEAREQGCRDIARQLVEFGYGDGIEVMLGGGRREFIPVTEADPEYPDQFGLRLDGANLIEEWVARSPGREFVWNGEQFRALDPKATGAVLGLFDYDHLHYELDRGKDPGNEPDLADMTGFAIQRLARAEKGFFLVVEGGRIDHGHHDNNAARALTDTLALERAVARALELTDANHTLIMVTADHGHVFTMSGYPPRGNPILGTVTPEESTVGPEILKWPYTTLGYANGPGYRPSLPHLSEVDTTDPEYRQFAGWPSAYETHSGEDVAAWANGRGSERLHGVMEQRQLYDVLAAALFDE